MSVDFRIPLPAEARQLRSYNVAAKERQLVVRTGESLLYVDANDESEEPSVVSIFSAPVCSFTQIPHMEGALGWVDEEGVLYYGEVGHPFIQAARLEEEVQAVVPTDCPRVLLAMSEKTLWEVDLRVPAGSSANPASLPSKSTSSEKNRKMPDNENLLVQDSAIPQAAVVEAIKQVEEKLDEELKKMELLSPDEVVALHQKSYPQ